MGGVPVLLLVMLVVVVVVVMVMEVVMVVVAQRSQLSPVLATQDHREVPRSSLLFLLAEDQFLNPSQQQRDSKDIRGFSKRRAQISV